jgi:hypothetical protein
MLLKEGRDELAALVHQAADIKKAALRRSIAKALLGSGEFKSFWKAAGAPESYPADVNIEPVQALLALNQMVLAWHLGDYSFGINRLEGSLFQIQMGDGGHLLSATWRMQQNLLQLNLYLDSVIASLKQCHTARPDYSVLILKNVVTKYFVGDVQVWAAELNRRQYALIGAFRTLEQTLGSPKVGDGGMGLESPFSEEYTQWLKARDALFEQTKEEIRAHVEKLKLLQDEAAVAALCAQS